MKLKFDSRRFYFIEISGINNQKCRKPRKDGLRHFWYPRRESNSQLTLRRGLLYPFNYGGIYRNIQFFTTFGGRSYYRLGGDRSIQLSYGGIYRKYSILQGSRIRTIRFLGGGRSIRLSYGGIGKCERWTPLPMGPRAPGLIIIAYSAGKVNWHAKNCSVLHNESERFCFFNRWSA